jgi:mono/diheme cytochrome c family protein
MSSLHDVTGRQSPFRYRLLAVLVSVALLLFFSATASAVDPTTATRHFQQQVAGILEQHCLDCHRGNKPKGGLDLSRRQHLLRGGESGPAIVSGKPAESLLIDYVSGKNPEMPKNGRPLSTDQVKILSQWIQSGAQWPENFVLQSRPQAWWAYQPLQRPPLPEISSTGTAWARTPIDWFIVSQREQRKLTPVPAADRRTLVRRLYYDLTGLPPTPHQMRAFVKSTDPLVYEKLVDQLLASPRYGERWGRHWLDVVKYGDTCGYDKDKLRTNAWPYRDYVVRSFNQDKSYSRFVQEQIAGDALFPETADGILGLGFIAAGPWDFIGHVEVPESKIDGRVARHLDRDDMVTNTFNTFLSTTIQCARCHDHKFDPFTQANYYSLQAVFAAVDRAERPYDTSQVIQQQRQQLTSRQAELQEQKKALDQEIEKAGGPELATLNREITRLAAMETAGKKHPAFGYHSQLSPKQNLSKWVQVDLGKSQAIQAVVLHPCHDDFNQIGAGFGFPVRFRVELSDDPKFQDKVHRIADETQADFSNPGLVPYRVSNVGRAARYLRITANHLAPRSADYILALAEVRILDSQQANLALKKPVTSLDSIQAAPRWSRNNLTDGIWARAKDPTASRQLAEERKKRQAILARIHTPEREARSKELTKQLSQVAGQIRKLPAGRMVYAAASMFKPQGNFKPTGGKPRPVHVLTRGDIQKPGKQVTADAPPLGDASLPRFQLDDQHTESDRRVALARWITDQRHPLTWRSLANRIWLYHFGQGLVQTPNDFGRMGMQPTHPQLLDWLACEFRDGGQSIKQIHRLIVTSAVYRLSSRVNPGNTRIDGNNQYLWRMNRRRLEAEEIRDSILAASGRLDLKMFGPGFYLFKLEKTAHSPHYEYHKHDPNDADSHRRSVYRFVVRSQPDPFMTTLDCADSSQSTPQRMETLTSLQALSLLNNDFTLAMAEHFARRLQREHSDVTSQVTRAVWLISGRTASPAERQQLSRYATQFGLPNLCRLLFNLSEFVYID